MLTGPHGLWRIWIGDYQGCAPSMIGCALCASRSRATAATSTLADQAVPVTWKARDQLIEPFTVREHTLSRPPQ
jgi:hypothetical protein